MINSLTALAIFTLLGASVIALPGFAVPVKADEVVAFAKADRLAVRPVVRSCSSQIWPNFDASCLRGSSSGILVQEARLVTARR